MQKGFGFAAATMFLVLGRMAWAEEQPSSVEPDLAALQAVVMEQIAAAHKPSGPDAGNRVHIRQVSYEEDLVPRDKAKKARPVYLLQVQEIAQPAMDGLWYVMVLKPQGKTFVPLLVYAGGFDSPVNAHKVDLGSEVQFREDPKYTAEAYPYRDLLVEDMASPNSTSMTRVLLFHYDEALGYFRNVFDECLTYTHRFEKPYDSFESTFAISDKGSLGMRDLVITTDWWVREWEAAYADGPQAEAEKDAAVKAGDLERKTTILHWDGKRYSGGLDCPKGAESVHPDYKRWFPEMTPSSEKAAPDSAQK